MNSNAALSSACCFYGKLIKNMFTVLRLSASAVKTKRGRGEVKLGGNGDGLGLFKGHVVVHSFYQ